MTKATARDKRLANLVHSLAANLSIPPTAFHVLQKCASLLGYEVQDDGHIATSDARNRKKRKVQATDGSNREIVGLQPSVVVEAEADGVIVTKPPLVVRDARRKKQASPMAGLAFGADFFVPEMRNSVGYKEPCLLPVLPGFMFVHHSLQRAACKAAPQHAICR